MNVARPASAIVARARATPVGAALLLLVALAGGAQAAEASADCAAVFNPATAQHVFEGVRTQTGADRCTLDDVRTDRSRMEIVWKSADGGILPAMVLEPAE